MTERGFTSVTDTGQPPSPEMAASPDFPIDPTSRAPFTGDRWRHNSDVAWDGFDPAGYWHHNYRSLREDDRAILRAAGRHFQSCFGDLPQAGRLGVDVGSGSNLYPALAMLPWCSSVLLTDHSTSNVTWLKAAARDLGTTWAPFWQELVSSADYAPSDFSDVRQLFKERVEVRQGNVFGLCDGATYDVGTMFFVAESLTNYPDEFEHATEKFLRALKGNAPFAAAFMDSSEGYLVGTRSFPAVKSVTVDRVTNVLSQLGACAQVEKIGVPAQDPLRVGYDGMIVAVGRVAESG